VRSSSLDEAGSAINLSARGPSGRTILCGMKNLTKAFAIGAGIVGVGTALGTLTVVSGDAPALQAAMAGIDLGAAVAAFVSLVALRDPADNWIEEQFA
jgi:hypothetical protein